MVNFVNMDIEQKRNMIFPERLEKIRKVVAGRQFDFTLILENVHDSHNIGAVLRTAESVGITEIYALYTVEKPDSMRKIAGHRSSSGAKKWVDIHIYTDIYQCFERVREKYSNIYSAHLSGKSMELYDLNLTESVALLFGNEHRGVSKDALSLSDGVFHIPQFGFTQSLNISVACAVSLYEGLRQRISKGMYRHTFDLHNPLHISLEEKYIEKTRPRIAGK